MPALKLNSPVKELPGVGPARSRALNRLGLTTLREMLRHYPMRYEQHQAEGRISDLQVDSIGSARGELASVRFVPMGGKGRSGGGRFQATLQDDSGTLSLTWFNGGFLRRRLHAGMMIRVTGKVGEFQGYRQMVNPNWEPIEPENETPDAQARLRPVYPATEDLSSNAIESLVETMLPPILPQIVDPLSESWLSERAMPPLAEAYRRIHRPVTLDEAAQARRRLAYNELLLLQLGMAIKRHDNQTKQVAPAMRFSDALDSEIRRRFPFVLTSAQDHVIADMVRDMQQTVPMNRLLQGDVGSGKTVVALYGMLLAAANRCQSALMTPTELLAEQHFLSIGRMLADSSIKLALLTGSLPAAEKNAILQGISDGSIDMVVGTQSLLSESVRFHRLGLAVIDEQHRFGVAQRAIFRQADGLGRHVLVMTATPIPRTLSLTVLGDLDVSIIQGLPPGRLPIVTKVVDRLASPQVYQDLASRAAQGEQAYVVVPAIDANSDEESRIQLKNVQEHLEHVRRDCPGVVVQAVHGRLKPEQRQEIMDRFRQGDIRILVATTVIEVGVDVPNATIMIVEHAERFGLAQLHQLRGRVGRGTHGRTSFCVLIAHDSTDEAMRRLQAMASTTDGFQIAEHDLAIRGMGDFFGTRQHGQPPLRLAQLPRDMPLLEMARRDAQGLVQSDPSLSDPSHKLLKQVLIQQHGRSLGLVDVG